MTTPSPPFGLSGHRLGPTRCHEGLVGVQPQDPFRLLAELLFPRVQDVCSLRDGRMVWHVTCQGHHA